MEVSHNIENHLNKLAIFLTRHLNHIHNLPDDWRDHYDNQNFTSRLERGQERLTSIIDIIARPHLKVVFVGRTSSGKSSAINALLNEPILPMGLGHTTSCFVEIRGSNQNQSWINIPGQEGTLDQRNSERIITSMNELGNALAEHPLQPDCCIQLFWPRSKAALLEDDVVLMDTPGLDVETDFDSWIDQFCLDADLFVWLMNGESTLMMREKAFFLQVKKKIAQPNIMVLVNRWDVASEEEEYWIHAAYEQHVARTLEFFQKELELQVSKSELLERMFFVSAKEQLEQKLAPGSTVRVSQDSLPSVKLLEERNNDWNRFLESLRSQLSCAYKGHRYLPYLDVGLDLARDIRDANDFVSKSGSEFITSKEHEIVKLNATMNDLEEHMEELTKELKGEVQTMLDEIEGMVRIGFEDELHNLSTFISEFHAVFHGDEQVILDVYRSQLIRHLENALAIDLSHCLSQNICDRVFEVQCQILARVTDLLPEVKRNFLDHQPRRMPIELNFFIQERQLFRDFHEDVSFKFSLRPANLFKCYSKVRSFLTSFSHGQDVMAETEFSWKRLLSWAFHASVATSEASIVALIMLCCLYRTARLRILLGTGLFFGTCYSVEKLMWTSKAKERLIKRQFEQFAIRKLSPLREDIVLTCQDQVRKELTNTLVLACGAAEGVCLSMRSEADALEMKCQDVMKDLHRSEDLSASCNELMEHLLQARQSI
ncbi:hypothetical protein TCAL_03815 [Tigriopus californicus]|uniref:Dynamin-type G domain-containing protein n=1 Tax=Tigriopus californicus TaxID=6832 RepID=A0A553NUB9_TIGCA|nr:transmembrane GTPase Marf-like [Tigriopus californicus]XP_059091461.1 transmembrane GTPase Marf-like [Tigriopus californicus]XP_059091469.1 transmembrane GTPase Marf-like [Tigriopus californicus]TRY69027.1 hypothetical protein TCAL_03815 [Tigriopus californicus]